MAAKRGTTKRKPSKASGTRRAKASSGWEEVFAGFLAAMSPEDAIELFTEYEEVTNAYEFTRAKSTRQLLEEDLNIEDLDDISEENATKPRGSDER